MKRFFSLLLLFAQCSFCQGGDRKMTIVRDPAVSNQPGPDGNSSSPEVGGGAGEWATIYVHGSTQRIEFSELKRPSDIVKELPHVQPLKSIHATHAASPKARFALITHCDTGVVDELYLDLHEYREFNQPKYPSEKSFRKMAARAKKYSEKEITTSTVDTGETRDFFGHPARHKITTIRQTAKGNRVSSDSFQKGTKYSEATYYSEILYKETLDGWYVDLPQPGCAPNYLRTGTAVPVTFPHFCDFGYCESVRGDVRELSRSVDLVKWKGFQAYAPLPGPSDSSIPFGFRAVTSDDSLITVDNSRNATTSLVYTGFVPSGLPVAQRISGEMTLLKRPTSKVDNETEIPWGYSVTEYSEEPLDPALFSVPPDFKKVKKID